MSIGTLARVTLNKLSGVPADAVVNDFVFVNLGAGTDADLINDIKLFYNAGAGPALPCNYISREVSRVTDSAIIELYDIPDAPGPMGSPRSSTPWTLGATDTGNTPYPSEVAIVISYNADLSGVVEELPNPTPPPATIRPRARRKGRLYIGPINSNAGDNSAGSTTPLRINADCRTSMVDSLDGMVSAALADLWTYSVFSRAEWECLPAVACSVDNAFDTQRRRGVGSTARTSLTF